MRLLGVTVGTFVGMSINQGWSFVGCNVGGPC